MNDQWRVCFEWFERAPESAGELIQAKYFGKVRDDIEIAECGVGQLKVKASDGDPIES